MAGFKIGLKNVIFVAASASNLIKVAFRLFVVCKLNIFVSRLSHNMNIPAELVLKCLKLHIHEDAKLFLSQCSQM